MTENDMTLIKLTDLVIVLLHGEDHVDNAPDNKDENEAGCVGEPPATVWRLIYVRPPVRPPVGGAVMLGA